MNGSSKTLYGKPARRIACKAQSISAISSLLIVELRRSAAELHRGLEPFQAPPVRFDCAGPRLQHELGNARNGGEVMMKAKRYLRGVGARNLNNAGAASPLRHCAMTARLME